MVLAFWNEKKSLPGYCVSTRRGTQPLNERIVLYFERRGAFSGRGSFGGFHANP